MKKTAPFILGLILLAGCSLDYSSVYVTDDLSEEIPDSIMSKFVHTSVRNGLPAFRLSAQRALVYNKKEETHLTDILFQEYNNAGKVATEGRADQAIFMTNTENAEFWGNLFFYSASEEASFSTSYLYWNSEENKLTGREDDQVRIRRDSGTEIRGTGFEAEARTRVVTFAGPVSGTYVQEEGGQPEE